MAEDKKSYIGYVDWGDTFDELTDDQAGKLIKHFYSYLRDENPVTDEQIINVAFKQIKLQLKRDLKEWENKKESRSQAGKKGMENRWKPITKDNSVIIPITNITVNDTVNVNDNVNVINTAAEAFDEKKAFEYLRRAAPVSTPNEEITRQVGMMKNQYGKNKIGNLSALCNKWASNMSYQKPESNTVPLKKVY